MIILITIVLILALIGSIIWKKNSDWTDTGAEIMIMPIGILLVAVVIFWPVIYCSNTSDIIKLETFYNTNMSNYEITLDNTAAMFSTTDFSDKLIEGNLEKSQLSSSVSDRLAELRDEVSVYNQKLASIRFFSNSFIGAGLYPKVPDYLLPIVLK